MAVPAATTFANLKVAILRYNKLVNDTAADTIAADAIRSGLLHLTAYRLKGLSATSDISLVATENTVTVPTDFNMPLSVHLLDANDKRDGRVVMLREESFDQFHDTQEGEPGVPAFYVQRGNPAVLEFDRAPSAAEVVIHPKVRVRYLKRIDVLVTATATFSVAPEFEEFLIWWGRKEVTAVYDAAKFPLAQQEASRAMGDLVKKETIRDEQDWV